MGYAALSVNKVNVDQLISQGPLLFVLFINDLPLHVSSANTDLYADDTTLSCSANWMDMDRLQISLNEAVSETVHWATANKLPLNQKKTKVLTICGQRNRIPTESLMILLFLLMDRNLKTYNVQSS